MKPFTTMLALFISAIAFAAPIEKNGIHEVLKNPSAYTSLKLFGEKDEATLLLKNAKRLSSIKTIIISSISDSFLLEQDISAIAACPNVSTVNFENCGMRNLSGALKMLVSVNEIGISNCDRLSSDQAFTMVADMPSVQIFNFQTKELKSLPSAFFRMRGMQKINIRNNDLTLADGYALNNSSPSSLFVSDSLALGFGESKLVIQYSCYDKNTLTSHISIMRDLLQGAVGENGTMTLPQRAIAFNRINALVHPPIDGLDVRKSIYTTNATTGGIVEYPSGTKINIPSHAFVDANGNEIKGDVTIDYREFRDPVDILVSGIPMQYDSAGEVGDFESAGMFEINASVNGQEVFLAPNKNVDVEFAVVDTASTFNFYKLDDKAGWVYQNQTGKVEQSEVITTAAKAQFVISDAVARYKKATEKMLRRRPSLGDTVSFDNRYQDTNYTYNNKVVRYNKESRKRQLRREANWSFKKYAAGKGNVCCKMSRVKLNSKLNYFVDPELQPFTNVMLKIEEPLSRSEFRKYLSKNAGITDIRMDYNGGSTFTMEVKYLWGFKTFSVSPVKMVDKKPVEYSEKACARMFRNYSRALDSRRKRLNRSINIHFKRYLNWQKAASKDSISNWKNVNPAMTSAEKPMDFQNWIGYVKNQDYLQDSINGNRANTQGSAVYQALSIQGFGIFNCDQVKRIQNPVSVFAKVLTQVGALILSSKVFVIAKNKNMVFSYYGNEKGDTKIIYGAQDENKLLWIAPDGGLSYTDESDFTRSQNLQGHAIGFPAVEIATKPISAEELRNILYPPVEPK